MRIRRRKLTFFGLVMFTGFSAFVPAMDRTPNVVGKVISSSNATVEGSALLSNGTILSGDAVYVGDGGSVLLSFSPTGRAALAAATNVRLNSARGNIVAQLLSGTIAVERENKDAFIVKTSTYRVQPQGEGKAEFLVALLPDKTTIVEAQHGKVAITETSSGESYTLAEGLRAEIPAFATGFPGQEEEPSKLIGKVVASAGATRNGKPLPSGGSVFEGDLVSTGAAGRTVIQLAPTSQITLNENTSASFTRIVQRVWLRLQNGAVVAENKGEGYVLVATTRFRIVPNSTSASRIYVGLMADNSTYVESQEGDARIEEIQSEQAYLLPAGWTTLVQANTTGLPGLRPLGATVAPTPAQSTPPSNPQPASVLKPHSHKTIIIVAAVAGGGIAATVAALSAEGGGGSQPVSPSAP